MGSWLKAENVLGLFLLFIPVTLVLEYLFHADAVLLFTSSALAIIPLAGLMGRSTEMLAERVGAGLGGLLNATFGNAAEMIIAAFALRAGLFDLVKASLTGSIIGNILLVFGLSALLGGLRYRRQHFNRTAARMGSTMLLLSAIALIIPAAYHAFAQQAAGAGAGVRALSLEISLVLIVCYGLALLFMLRTHQHLYVGEPVHIPGGETGGPVDRAAEAEPEDGHPREHGESRAAHWSTRRSLLVLVASAAVVGWMSEILVGAAEDAAHTLGMNEVFIGVIVVALIGNAAEHSSAVLMAIRNNMDLAIQIAIGSSVQIALFVAPVLVFLSYWIAPGPMDLRFTGLEVVAVGLSVLAIAQIADDGETHWMEGVLLLAVYAILGLAFFSLPG